MNTIRCHYYGCRNEGTCWTNDAHSIVCAEHLDIVNENLAREDDERRAVAR